jgi:hypothetical protein
MLKSIWNHREEVSARERERERGEMFSRFTGSSKNSATDSKANEPSSTSQKPTPPPSSSATTTTARAEITVSPKVKSNNELGLPSEEDFVNHGLQRFNEIRAQWKNGNGKYAKPTGPEHPLNNIYNERLIRPRPRTNSNLDADEITDRIFSNNPSEMVLPEPVPLSQMVDVLLDVWEADGLYD